MMKNEIQQICIDSKASILAALKQMDVSKHKLLIVTDSDRFFSMLSIGDIQRAIIKGVGMSQPITDILRANTKVATIHDDKEALRKQVKDHKNEFMPIIDDDNNIVDVIFWDELFHTHVGRRTEDFNLPVIIMAGGQGTRLRTYRTKGHI